VELIDIRDYTLDRHRRTDDYPFGGGAGMVMSAQPIVDAFAANLPDPYPGRRIYLSPRGRTLTQRVVEELAGQEELALLCGHYEGVDQRALDAVIDEELSIGDYVLTGGELGALVLIDAVSRLVPGVLGSEESSEDESFSTGLLEYPQYTRPADFRGARVPQVLLDGNHADITAWRREQSLSLTLERRPELLEGAPLDEGDRAIVTRLTKGRDLAARLRSAGVDCARVELRLADGWPRRWLEAFVPPERLREAKKQCLNGRRHVGFLWQAFTLGFIPGFTQGNEALAAWQANAPGRCLLYLPGPALLFEIADPAALTPQVLVPLGQAVLTDELLSQTLVLTDKTGVGPFWGRAEA